jgi:hypothetical protein
LRRKLDWFRLCRARRTADRSSGGTQPAKKGTPRESIAGQFISAATFLLVTIPSRSQIPENTFVHSLTPQLARVERKGATTFDAT